MKKSIIAGVAFLLLARAALAADWMKAADFTWPTHSCPVVLCKYGEQLYLQGERLIHVGWVDGHPMADRHDCATLLGLPPEGQDIDLQKVLIEKDYLLRLEGETIYAKPTPDNTVVPRPSTQAWALSIEAKKENESVEDRLRLQNYLSPAEQYQADKAARERAEALKPRVVVKKTSYSIDQSFCYAQVEMVNVGGSRSLAGEARADFHDVFGHTFAHGAKLVPSLGPGSSTEITFMADASGTGISPQFSIQVAFHEL